MRLTPMNGLLTPNAGTIAGDAILLQSGKLRSRLRSSTGLCF